MLTMYGEMFGQPRPAPQPKTDKEMAETLRAIALGDTDALLLAVAPTLEESMR